jgi:DNA-binding transcriptional regulator LsrR (DeoR family)
MDPQVADTLELAGRADVALVGIGAFELASTLLAGGKTLTPEEVADLKACNVAGDIALQFFDAEGRKVDHPINDRIIGTDIKRIKEIGRVIGVAGGPQKRQAIRAALRGRLINVLVTDDQTAKWLLE